MSEIKRVLATLTSNFKQGHNTVDGRDTALPYPYLYGVLLLGLFLFLWRYADAIYPEDWMDYYYPASQEWENRADYEVYNPPWLILILKPLFAVGWKVGYAILGTVSMAGIGWCAYAMSEDGHWLRVLLAVVNIPALMMLGLGQIDGLAIIGVGLAAVFVDWKIVSGGILLALIKPQISLPCVLISFWKNPHQKHIAAVGAAVGILSLLVWGFWIGETADMNTGVSWNQAFPYWPYGLVIGLPLLAVGLYQKEELYGAAAVPFLIPYIGPHSLIIITVVAAARLPLRWCWLGWIVPMIWFVAK